MKNRHLRVFFILNLLTISVFGQGSDIAQYFEDKKNASEECSLSNYKYDFEVVDEAKIKADFDKMIADLKLEKDPFSDYELKLTADTSTREYKQALGFKVLSLMNANNENIAKPNQLIRLTGFGSSSNISMNDRSIYKVVIKEPTNDLVELKARAYLTYQPSSKKTVFAKTDIGKIKTYRGVKYKLKYFSDGIILFDYFTHFDDFDYQVLSKDDFIIECRDYYITSGKSEAYETLKSVYGIDNIPLGEESGAMVIFTSATAQQIVFEEAVNKKVMQKEFSVKMSEK